ncbi:MULTISPECIES: hypothetical protein [Pseudonocardia]|uniref:hypothetical protein n=1 Tax=Pseudonocardia TaxID=1847 RepID=UPI000E32D530|nr:MULTISPECIES: hypothetical protein [Pseudonocardia]BBG04841.1 hypothetical protein Pdca_60500 [Pseudonocardia autotrophica]
MSNNPGEQGAPQYYRPGPSTGHYPQYPQNPYPNGWTPAAAPAPQAHPQPQPHPQPHPQAHPQAQAQPGPQWNTGSAPQGWGQPPAGLAPGGTTPVARPRQVVTALILLIAAALPFVLMGAAAMVAQVDQATLDQAGVPRAELDAVMAQAGVTMEQLTQLVRVMGGVFLVLALVYAALAVVAFLGRPGARLALAVLTAVYGLPLLLLMAPTIPVFAVAILAISSAGVVLLYGQAAREWYASRKVGAARRAG